MTDPKVVRRSIRYSQDGINVAADINAVVSDSGDGSSRVTSRQSTRVVQSSRTRRGAADDTGPQPPAGD